MGFEQETEWKLHPLNGETGQAYMGIKNQEKLFVKRNTSPFLAALSLEGISPRLVWTKRVENGDVLTAQEWCNGRNLNRMEMHGHRVAQILKKVHSSSILKKMLEKVGGKSTTPRDFLRQFHSDLSDEIKSHPTLVKALIYLEDNKDWIHSNVEYTVCHGESSHKNWLLSEEDELYLVDWDSVVLADPAFDIGQLLSRYISKNEWENWLNQYDSEYTSNFKKRIEWYSIMSLILDVKSEYNKSRFHHMNDALLKINQWIN